MGKSGMFISVFRLPLTIGLMLLVGLVAREPIGSSRHEDLGDETMKCLRGGAECTVCEVTTPFSIYECAHEISNLPTKTPTGTLQPTNTATHSPTGTPPVPTFTPTVTPTSYATCAYEPGGGDEPEHACIRNLFHQSAKCVEADTATPTSTGGTATPTGGCSTATATPAPTCYIADFSLFRTYTQFIYLGGSGGECDGVFGTTTPYTSMDLGHGPDCAPKEIVDYYCQTNNNAACSGERDDNYLGGGKTAARYCPDTPTPTP